MGESATGSIMPIHVMPGEVWWDVIREGRRFTRRAAGKGAVAAAAVAAVGALGGGAASAAATQNGKIKLEFRAWTQDASYQTEADLMQRAVAPWLSQNPGVDLVVHAQAGSIGNVMSQLLAGTGPDVYHSWHPQSVFSNPLFAQNLTPYVKKYNADLSVFNQTQLAVFQQPRGLLALPYYLGTYAMAFNLTLFDDAGIAYPDQAWDYRAYEHAARALTKKGTSSTKQIWGGSLGLGWMGSPPTDATGDPFVPPFIAWGFGGGSYVDPSDPSRCVADSTATVKANEWAYGLSREGVVNNAGAWYSFTSGQYAMAPAPSFDLTAAAEQFRQLKWDFWPMPTFPHGPATGATEDMLVMNPATKYPDLAWDFMYWIAFKPDWQRSMMALYLLSPALTSLWEEWVRVVGQVAPPLRTKNVKVFADMAELNRAFPKQIFAYQATQADGIFAAWGQKMSANQISVAEGLRQITSQVNALEAVGPQEAAQSAAALSKIVAELKQAQNTPKVLTFGPPPRVDAGLPPTPASQLVTVKNNTYTLIGQGKGPAGQSDSGTFAAMPFDLSKGTFSCRITGIYAYQNSTIQDGCQVALMARSSLADAAANATIGYATGHGVHLHSRSLPSVGEGDQKDGTAPGLIPRARFHVNDYAAAKNYLPMPLWLQLSRDGGQWTAYTSLNGKTWAQAGNPVTLEVGGVWIGLWVNSNTAWNANMKIQASFDDLTFKPITFVQVGTP